MSKLLKHLIVHKKKHLSNLSFFLNKYLKTSLNIQSNRK